MELLRSCGINILVVFSDIPKFCLDYKLPTTKNIRTRNTGTFLFYVKYFLYDCCFSLTKNVHFQSGNMARFLALDFFLSVSHGIR